MLRCGTCRQLFHSDCVGCLSNKLLQGDTFYTFKCSVCGKGRQEYERPAMSWLNITHFAVYTLLRQNPAKEFVRWKEEICLFIDTHWEYLKPGKPRSPTWHNTVASILSTSHGKDKVFKSGTEKFGQPGYWGLNVLKPPESGTAKSGVKPRELKNTPKEKDSTPTRVSQPHVRKKRDRKPIDDGAVRTGRLKAEPFDESKCTRSGIAGPSLKRKLSLEDVSDASLTKKVKSEPLDNENGSVPATANTSGKHLPASKPILAPRQRNDRHKPVSEDETDIFGDDDSDLSSLSSIEDSDDGRGNPSHHASAEKQSRIRFGGLGKGKGISRVEAEGYANSSDVRRRSYPSVLSADDDEEDEEPEDFTDDLDEEDQDDTDSDTDTDEELASETRPLAPEANHKARDTSFPSAKPKYHTFVTPEQEYNLLQLLSDAANPLPPAAARLRRKIQLRRHKRTVGARLFDFDSVVSRSLRDPHHRRKDSEPTHNAPSSVRLTPLIYREPDGIPSLVTLADGRIAKLIIRGMDSKLALQRFRAVRHVSHTKYEHSFLSRIEGQLTPKVTVSPYSGKPLPSYVWRSYPDGPAAATAPPQQRMLEIISGKSRPIDYKHLDSAHLSAVNDLLSRVFWPGIDVAEALTYPEYTLVALYGRVAIGVAVMTPEGYLSYLAVKSGWNGAGIARFMLFYLIQAVSGKDITLHVSANNKAMLLYQRMGFKPEEFIVGFYDKYLPPESTACKNAFFVRLRR
ncbi:uncharacterized protein EV422DRAFT_134636 [Fimicolochytrium jonesii]|uniref:uncharacterized protein n=1 Tax=Fimicolochytrium jonesii TaxID=1396493 RepID=UPI0022FF2025|nr:uncharacterized protein EV422DRAFT_134636 [Fimicolochytrium jonesii]KAI8825639.1 hypothetical protein EV422DRAFT_134636 [Fimicolochytrium jonesii]